MRNQLWQVWRTYSRRPLLRLIGGLALLFAIVLAFQSSSRHNSTSLIAPELQRPENILWDLDSPEEIPPETRLSEIGSIEINNFGDEQSPDLSALQHVTTLHLETEHFDEEKLQAVSSLPELESLALETHDLSPQTWQTLGPRLRQLQIPCRLLLMGNPDLASFTRLQLLIVDRTGLTPAAIEEIAKLPNLRTLVISDHLVDRYASTDTATANPLNTGWLTPTDLLPLAGQASLRSVFATWSSKTGRTSSELPGVVHYPNRISNHVTTALTGGMLLTGAVALAVALQVWVHFMAQSSAVIPGYARPHLWIAVLILLLGVLILLLGVLVTILGLCAVGIAVIPAAAISLVLPTLFLSAARLSQSPGCLGRYTFRFLCIFSGVSIWLMFLLQHMLPPAWNGELVWMLRGETVVAPLTLLCVEVVALGSALFTLPTLAKLVYEQSVIRPGLSPWDPQFQKRNQEKSKYPGLMTPSRALLARLSAKRTRWKMARLWKSGNPYRPIPLLLLFGAAYAAFSWFSERSIGGSLGTLPTWGIGLFQVSFLAVIFPFAIWHGRCRSLSVECLRPVSRKELARQLFLALAMDQAWAVIPAGGLCLIAMRTMPAAASAAGITLLTAVVVLLWFYAMSTTVFSVRSNWILVALIAVMLVAPSLLAFLVIWIFEEAGMNPLQRSQLLVGPLLAFACLAVAILGISYRRTVRREFG